MKITKDLLREMIKEELVALKEEMGLKPDQLTPEQQALRNKKVMQFLSDPAVHKLQKKYGIFLSKVPLGDDYNSYDLLSYFGLDAKAVRQKDVSDVMPNLKKSGENLSNKEYNKSLYQYVRTKKIVDGMKNSPFYDQELSDLRKQRAALLKMRAKDPTLPEPPPIG